MESYYDALVAELIGGGMPHANNYLGKRLSPGLGGGLPQGMSPESLVDQTTGAGMSERDARRFASGAEDEWLRGALGSERKKGKGDRTPPGSYAMSWYPGQEMDIDMAYGRVIPPDAEARMSREQKDYWQKKMMEWQNMQRSMLPKHGNFVSRMGGR